MFMGKRTESPQVYEIRYSTKNYCQVIVLADKKKWGYKKYSLYHIQVGTKNKNRQIRKRALYTMKLGSLSTRFHPPLYRRRELLALTLSSIYFTSRLLCDGSCPEQTEKPVQD
jgi:hypothetical protein